MDDCPTCGRRLDGGECARCAVINGQPETAEKPQENETATSKRPARKTTAKGR